MDHIAMSLPLSHSAMNELHSGHYGLWFFYSVTVHYPSPLNMAWQDDWREHSQSWKQSETHRNKAQDLKETTALSFRLLRKPTIKWWACSSVWPISLISTGLIQVCFHASYEWKAINKGAKEGSRGLPFMFLGDSGILPRVSFITSPESPLFNTREEAEMLHKDTLGKAPRRYSRITSRSN